MLSLKSTAAPAALIVCLTMLQQSVIAGETTELEHVIVTAGLEPLAIEDVSGSLTVISREDIERRQVKYLSELLRSVPGFAVSQAGGPGGLTQVRVRGAEANHLLVLIDGVRANDPAAGDEFQFQYALTSDIERIEIIRGPQSATWGTDALAGVINIIRRNDIDSGEYFVESEAEAGSFGSFSANARGGMHKGRLRLSGGVTYLETDGINVSRAGDEKDGAENTSTDAQVEIEAGDSLRLRFTGQRVDARSDFDGISFVTGLPEDTEQYTDAEQTYISAVAAWNPEGRRWDASSSLNWLDSDNQNFSFGAWDSSTAADTLEFRLRSSIALATDNPASHRLALAYDYRDVSFSQRGMATQFGDPNHDQSYDVSGYAVEYVGRPNDSLTWTISARQDRFSEFDDATSWQVAASKRFGEDYRLRGSLGTGSKAPTFIERFGFFPDFFLGNPALEPESSRGWEIGIDAPLGNSGFTLGATWFDQELEDEIDGFVFDPETFFFTARNRPDQSDRQGLELTLSGQFPSGFSLDASYTYTDATDFSAGGSREQELRRPEHMASLNLNQSFGDERGNLNLNVNYNGAQLDNFFPPPEFGRVLVELGHYVLVDFSASWVLNSNFELTGRVTNLLDENYEDLVGFSQPARGYFAGLRARF